jgi:hypothetical protein
MLPTPDELRAQSHRLREAALHAPDEPTKRRLANDALVLAQLAEAIERNGGIRRAKVEQYERLVAGILGEDALRAPDAAQKVEAHMRSQIRAWRARAEELRTTASQFEIPTAQESLRSAARNFDLMADNLENLLKAQPPAKRDKAC